MPEKNARIKDLTKVRAAVLEEIRALVGDSSQPETRAVHRSNAAAGLIASIQGWVDQLEASLKKQGRSPGDLSSQSRQFFSWMSLLRDPDHFRMHLETLNQLSSAVQVARFHQKARLVNRSLPVQVQFYNSSVLYRLQQTRKAVELTAHEGFTGAPNDILEALAYSALVRKTPSRLKLLRGYARSERFLRIARQLDLRAARQAIQVQGQAFNLEEVFERVNGVYFSGSLAKPLLTWNRRRTIRTFGHYHPGTDVVTISKTLDNLLIPEYVLDYVMYHELLHKKLGVKQLNGRKYAHTGEFRRAEREFHLYTQAKEFLRKLSLHPL